MELRNANVLVTGGSLGIGKATAKALVKAGARVAITGRDEARVHKAADEIGAFPIAADVAEPAEIARTFDQFLGQFDRLDCLINNAGIGTFKHLDGLSMSDFENVFSVNVFGAALMAQRATMLFKEQGFGHIVNIGSTAGQKGFAGGTVYAASKFALRGMTQCWQGELRKHNIRVMLVEPSEVATAFGDPERKERTAPPNKLTADDIAHAITSVLSMDSRGMIPELQVWATNPW
jgi:3-oxoacyl-[acyl-carrier protein] reductase